jgi:hypothetical protein
VLHCDHFGAWREQIATWTDDVAFAQPADRAAITACEATLGQHLPTELIDLLLESNGVEGEYGLGLVWPIEQIARDNLMIRTDPDLARLYMPFEPLLFFADAGNGDQFAFVMRDCPPDVFAWNHETDSRIWVAPGLARYLEWWLNGRITI